MQIKSLVISGLGALLFITGCGVPKDRYNTQVIRANKMQARAEKAETTLGATKQKLVTVEGDTLENKKVIDNQKTIISALKSSLKKILTHERKSIKRKLRNRRQVIKAVVEKEVKRKCKISFSHINLKAVRVFEGVDGKNSYILRKKLNDVINPSLKGIASCFQRGKVKKKAPFISKFGFSFTVNKKGKVKNINLSHKMRMAKKAKKCVFKSIKKIKFGKINKPIYAYYMANLKVIQKNKPHCKTGKKHKKGKKAKRRKRSKKSKKHKKSKKSKRRKKRKNKK